MSLTCNHEPAQTGDRSRHRCDRRAGSSAAMHALQQTAPCARRPTRSVSARSSEGGMCNVAAHRRMLSRTTRRDCSRFRERRRRLKCRPRLRRYCRCRRPGHHPPMRRPMAADTRLEAAHMQVSFVRTPAAATNAADAEADARPTQRQLTPAPPTKQQQEQMDDDRAPKRDAPPSPAVGDSPSAPRAKRTLLLPPPTLPPPSIPPSPPPS